MRVSGFQPLFPLEVKSYNPLENVAASLAFDMIFRVFPCFVLARMKSVLKVYS